MSQAHVVVGTGEGRRRVPVGSALVVGRAGGCDLVIEDSSASRRHLEIRASGGGFMCRDLGSRNGTEVNGIGTTACELSDGDIITLGRTVLHFELSDEAAKPATEKTIFLQTVLDRTGRVQQQPPTNRSKELLEAAYTLLNAIASNFNTCDLVNAILRTTLEAVRGQRGAILFTGPDGELTPCGVCGAVHTIQEGVPRAAGLDEIQISETVARRVVRDGENVMLRFGEMESDADSTPSICALNTSSLLCVPIRTQHRILGVLYIDTDARDHDYNDDDLLLAAAAGNSAGLALENASIHKSLLEKDRIEQEIAAAWTIQEGFLVKDWPADDPRFEVYGETRPAKTVGGDFYDFIQLDADTVGLLIGDVSGKGVPAALTMAQVLAEFRLLCARDSATPAEVVRSLNERLVERSRRGTFCTMCFVTVDLRSGRVVGANAGHHAMLQVAGGETSSLLGASGPPTGILPDGGWEDQEASVRPGDTMLLYTDGVVEARSGSATAVPDTPAPEYRLERLERVVRSHCGGHPREMIENVVRDVHQFCLPMSPNDDCTMIALRYRGHGN